MLEGDKTIYLDNFAIEITKAKEKQKGCDT